MLRRVAGGGWRRAAADGCRRKRGVAGVAGWGQLGTSRGQLPARGAGGGRPPRSTPSVTTAGVYGDQTRPRAAAVRRSRTPLPAARDRAPSTWPPQPCLRRPTPHFCGTRRICKRPLPAAAPARAIPVPPSLSSRAHCFSYCALTCTTARRPPRPPRGAHRLLEQLPRTTPMAGCRPMQGNPQRPPPSGAAAAAAPPLCGATAPAAAGRPRRRAVSPDNRRLDVMRHLHAGMRTRSSVRVLPSKRKAPIGRGR